MGSWTEEKSPELLQIQWEKKKFTEVYCSLYNIYFDKNVNLMAALKVEG